MMRTAILAEILLVEDSPSDILMTREALQGARVGNNLHVVEDGVEALDFLRRKGKYADVVRPHLILLDLNLPKKSGLEVLQEIKGDPILKSIPVIMLTTSQAEADVLKAYDLHANCYISKPVEFGTFAAVIRSIEKFWFTVVILPEENL